MNKRLSHIDLLETIAIFFVIMYHCHIFEVDFTNGGTGIDHFLYFSKTILSTCVPLFFFVNGYLLFNRPFNLKKHIHKMIRLIVQMIVWMLILMSLYLIIAGEPLSVKTVLLNVLNMSTEWSVNVFWFVGQLICIYILFPALKALFDRDKTAFGFFVIVCALMTFGIVLGNEILAFSVLIHHKNLSLNFPFITMLNPFRGSYGYSFVYFCVGGLIFTYEDRIRAFPVKHRNIISVLGMIISCSLLYVVGVFYSTVYGNELWDIIWNGYDTVFTFANVIFIYLLSLNLKKEHRVFRNVSVNTLGIFYIHYLIIRLTRPLILERPVLCNLPFNIVYGVGILLVSLVFCLGVKRIPGVRKGIC